MQEGTPIIIKKKKAHGHAHHGGAWKVAYADFVTAMMAFFMVMWIMGMDQPTREMIAGYFKDPIGFEKNTPKHQVNLIKDSGSISTSPGRNGRDSSARSEMSVMKKIEDKVVQTISKDPQLKSLEQNKAVKVEMTPEGLKIELTENEMNSELFFKLGSAEVRPQARSILTRLAPVLAQTHRKMVVDGHTDARPLNRPGYDNFDLSHDRANAVRRILVQGGCPVAQFIAVTGHADNQLRVPSDPYHFSNRRVSVLIPYAFKQAGIQGLPADVNRESIEGVFKMPNLAGGQ
ncbi:MAG: OmpA family protein [Armatimonadetes bacterium]|nr:OmpA family protein [Armatimonadota bacterium]